MHPLLNALFNEEASEPSKQLIQARVRLRESGASYSVLIILPPAELVEDKIDLETLYHDAYLLSHVAMVDWSHPDSLETMNGSQWTINLTGLDVVPGRGFPLNSSYRVKVKDAMIWSPGLEKLSYDASYLIIKVDGLLLNSEATKRFSLFGKTCSAPKTTNRVSGFPVPSEPQLIEVSPTLKSKPRNPALALGKSKSQQEQSMAKVDYVLACLQQDVVSSAELASRFHDAVKNVQKHLVEAGGVFVEEGYEGPPVPNGFSLGTLYEYAEYRLGQHLLVQLDSLLMAEAAHPSFAEVQKELANLDIGQVDIPEAAASWTPSAFERAVCNSALKLGGLREARDSRAMCQIFLSALKELANPTLGMVSADTLLGLFMLSMLRTSEDAAAVVERDLYFVMNFSLRASHSPDAKLNEGRLSYTLMVVESVLLQLRLDLPRLKKLSDYNAEMWEAVRESNQEAIRQLYKREPTALTSRRSGKSALFVAAEDNNAHMLQFLLNEFPSIFSRDFVVGDKDMKDRTLLMAALGDVETIDSILKVVGNDPEYYTLTDVDGSSMAHMLQDDPEIIRRLSPFIDWCQKDGEGDTPILKMVKRYGKIPVEFVSNFFDHIDQAGNSLLHFSARQDEANTRALLALHTCDVNWANNTGETALTKASAGNAILLMEAGADPWLKNQQMIKPVRIRREFAIPASVSDVDEARMEVCLGKPLTDLVGLGEALRVCYSFSWTPTLRQLYKDVPKDSQLWKWFGPGLSFDDDVRLSSWIRQIISHGTFKDSKLLLDLTGSRSGPQDGAPRTSSTSPQSGRENLDSITAFFQLGISQLDDMQRALMPFARVWVLLSNLQQDQVILSRRFERDLLELAKVEGVNLRLAISGVTSSIFPRACLLTLVQLVEFTRELQANLRRPLTIAAELTTTTEALIDGRARLRDLAERRASPSWLPKLEEKRVAEIQGAEDSVSKSRRRIIELDEEIQNTHFSLASELSAFSESHEGEILGLIKEYTQMQLQYARGSLTKLKYGSST